MGSREGALKARDTRLKKNPNVYSEMGTLGGKASSHRPFKDLETASLAGKKSAEVRKKKRLDLEKEQA
jgi:general stress protein YciG